MSLVNGVWDYVTKGAMFLIVTFRDLAHTIVAKVLATMGLSLVSFNALLPQLKAFVLQYSSGMPQEAMQLLMATGVGEMMAMIMSALTVKMATRVFVVPTSVKNSMGLSAP